MSEMQLVMALPCLLFALLIGLQIYLHRQLRQDRRESEERLVGDIRALGTSVKTSEQRLVGDIRALGTSVKTSEQRLVGNIRALGNSVKTSEQRLREDIKDSERRLMHRLDLHDASFRQTIRDLGKLQDTLSGPIAERESEEPAASGRG